MRYLNYGYLVICVLSSYSVATSTVAASVEICTGKNIIALTSEEDFSSVLDSENPIVQKNNNVISERAAAICKKNRLGKLAKYQLTQHFSNVKGEIYEGHQWREKVFEPISTEGSTFPIYVFSSCLCETPHQPSLQHSKEDCPVDEGEAFHSIGVINQNLLSILQNEIPEKTTQNIHSQPPSKEPLQIHLVTQQLNQKALQYESILQKIAVAQEDVNRAIKRNADPVQPVLRLSELEQELSYISKEAADLQSQLTKTAEVASQQTIREIPQSKKDTTVLIGKIERLNREINSLRKKLTEGQGFLSDKRQLELAQRYSLLSAQHMKLTMLLEQNLTSTQKPVPSTATPYSYLNSQQRKDLAQGKIGPLTQQIRNADTEFQNLSKQLQQFEKRAQSEQNPGGHLKENEIIQMSNIQFRIDHALSEKQELIRQNRELFYTQLKMEQVSSHKKTTSPPSMLLHLAKTPGAKRPDPRPTPSISEQMSSGLGLANLGNTCFANSAHKLMTALPGLGQFLDNHEKYSGNHQEKREKRSLNQRFFTLMTALSDNRSNIAEARPIRISEDRLGHESGRVFSALKQVAQAQGKPLERKLQGTIGVNQIDSAEYLNELLNALNYKEHFGGVDFMMRNGTVSPTQTAENMFKAIFTGDRPTTTNQVIQDYLRTNQTALIQTKDKAPDHFILELQRINPATGGKNRTPIDIGEIDLDYYDKTKGATNRQTPTTIKMKPTSIIVHQDWNEAGSSGHYVSYTWDKGLNTWVIHDDRQVRPLYGAELERAKESWTTRASVVLYSAN